MTSAAECDERVGRWKRDAVAVLGAADAGLDVEALWGDVRLLPALDRMLEGVLAGTLGGPGAGDDPASSRLTRASAIALGEVLVRELTVEWSGEPTLEEVEPVLRFAGSEVTLYPLRMVRAHLEGARRDGAPIRLERLVRSTGAYLDHLVRYFPSRLGLARRSRGSRRGRPDS